MRKPKTKECNPRGPDSGESTVYRDETVEELERSLLVTVHEATTAAVELAMEGFFRQLQRAFEQLATEMRAQMAIIKDQIARLEKRHERVYRSEGEASNETGLAGPVDASDTILETKRRVPDAPRTVDLKKENK